MLQTLIDEKIVSFATTHEAWQGGVALGFWIGLTVGVLYHLGHLLADARAARGTSSGTATNRSDGMGYDT